MEIQTSLGLTVCELELEGGWLSWVETQSFFQRQGWATKLACYVISKYGEFDASSASQQQHRDYDKDDTRYLTQDGAAFIQGLIRKGVFDPARLHSPFM